jgi:probable HAF family extracellular repeat protein
MRARFLVSTALFVVCLGCQASAETVVLSTSDYIYGITPAGDTIFGAAGNEPVRWDITGASFALPMGGYDEGEVTGMGSNGALVGSLSGEGGDDAVYWSSASAAPVNMASSLGSANSYAHKMSDNGAYATATYFAGAPKWNQGFVYNTGTGVATLLPTSGVASNADDVTNDGAVVVGNDYNSGLDITRATYWYYSDGSYTQHMLSAVGGEAKAVSAGGEVIVGVEGGVAAKWDQTAEGVYGSTVSLGTLGGATSDAINVNTDGSVIVGSAKNAEEASRAFRWTDEGGMQSVEDWLSDNGVTNSLGSNTYAATGVSSDGNIVVGVMSHGVGFIARVIPEEGGDEGEGGEGGESGLITIDDLSRSLTNSTMVPHALSFSSDLVMHGAHGHPLLRVVPEGKSTVWMNGDLGFVATHGGNAYNHVAEIGGGQRVSKNVQVNLSAGKMFAGQQTVFNGEYTQDLTYILPEVIVNFDSIPVWATLSFQYAGGKVDVTRGYLNAGNQDYSKGSPHADVYAARARFDWKDALSYCEATFTPYVDHQHAESVVGAYTETGGAFPVRWDERRQHDDITRIGVDAGHRVNKDLSLYGTVEQVHWWQGKGASASGEVIGVSNFNLSGQKYARDWTQISVGASHAVGDGKVTAFANAKTTGQLPQYWLAVGYQYDF